MAPRNRPSKGKRNARNRARREALAARSEAARERSESESPVSEPRQGFLSRLFMPRPATPSRSDASDGGDEDGDDRQGEEGAPAGRRPPLRGKPKGAIPRDDRGRVPGHRAVLFALFFAIASVGLLIFVPVNLEREISSAEAAPEGCEIQDRAEDADPEDQLICIEEETIPSELGWAALPILAAPVVITGLAYRATTRDRQARTWTWSLVAFAVFLFAFPVGGIILIPSLVALTVATFQARRAEQRLLAAEHQAGLHDDDGDGGDGGVIDTTAEDTHEIEGAEEEDDDGGGPPR